MKIECNKLDAYLGGDLPAEAATRFEQHLTDCDSCGEAIAQQGWIDELLSSPIRSGIEAAPHSLIESVRWSISERRPRVRLAVCGLAAAAVLFVAVVWLELNGQARGRSGHVGEQADVAEVAREQERAPADATFVGGADVIAVPIESHQADVTIVRIYPTYRPQNERDAVATDPNEPNFTWHDYSTGG
jgi:anti-sigma factor RsiW